MDLAIEALDLASDWVSSGESLGDLLLALEAMHPAIATVRNVAREIRASAHAPVERINQLRESLANGNRIIAARLADIIPTESVVVTLSNSSTVLAALEAVGPRGVYVMESHPGGEGADMADALRLALAKRAGHEFVSLIPDDSIDRFVPAADYGLVGIDTFDASGAIWHKIGTLPLARLCRVLGKPLYAAGHSLKRSDRELDPIPPPDPETGARLFDRTPGELITRLITECG